MSLNDPILRDIKGHLLKLHEDGIHKPISDVHPNLLPFCQSLENALRKGLRRATTALGTTKQDYWIWIYNLPDHIAHCTSVNERNMTIFKAAIETTRRHTKLKTTQGRGRYFLRLSLQKHIISVPVILLIKSGDFRTKYYDVSTSLLGDDFLCDVLLSALQEADGIEFALNLQNSSFLDETWLLPIYRTHEFIPCRHLGIKIGYIKGRATAVHVKEGSPAADDDIIEVGDILDELFSESLYDCKRSKIPSLLRQHRGKPISVAIAKGHFHSGELFPPAASILRQLGLNVESLTQTYKRKQLEKRNQNQLDTEETLCETYDLLMHTNCDNLISSGHRVVYIGNVYVGEDGSKDKITNGIMEVMKTSNIKQDVILETQEAHLLVKEFKTGKALFEHCYTRIGACGRPKSPASFFAYTIGETTCSLSNHFTCYVFQADNPEMSKDILLNIAKGFERTHWAV